METAPLLQHFELETAYDPPVSRPLTLHVSNRVGAELRHPAVRGGGSDMGAVISFPAVGRTARSSRSIAGRSESATVIILPVVRIERYADAPTGGFEPEANSGPRRHRRLRATRS